MADLIDRGIARCASPPDEEDHGTADQALEAAVKLAAFTARKQTPLADINASPLMDVMLVLDAACTTPTRPL
ncbi:hypothetical protein XpopCFBP1817_00195 [Xanthomonas populi]|uniref:Uncharacterized protein n=1 Tax=Xanthomonas populi TaxID=53414 RepID=A0A2S7F4S0_9XANT|nr:hypothetical protein [Xanthomonas populi]PPV00423.1 hypothetical protein XpopCFBP1817_00195 [Xanthomonas populi]